jgi:DNA-binding response OmpR family regulator
MLPENDSDRRPILIVDDDIDVITIARRVLEHAGWSVVGTTDPRKGLDMVLEHRPCLVIVDLMMPHLDGEELLWSIRDRLKDEMPKIALLSAAYSRAEIARRLGVDATIPKPFEIDDLRDLAARFCAVHRDRRSSRPPRA